MLNTSTNTMQLHLFATVSAPPVPPAPKPERKPRRKRGIADMTVDQQIALAARWYGVILNFNAKPDQPSTSTGYAEAQKQFNEVFAVLALKFSPAQILAFCMEEA
jgi:hypothetical protein